MFIEVIILGIIIGYLLKGSLKNIDDKAISHIELIFIAFIMEAGMVVLIGRGIVLNNTISFCLDFLMYIVLAVFVYLNRRMYQVLIMGLGFLLNAVAIFSNGGAMPVSGNAAIKVGINGSVAAKGLYKLADSNTHFYILCDIIPKTFLRTMVLSIGDIIAAVGLFLLILKLMKCKKVFSGEDI